MPVVHVKKSPFDVYIGRDHQNFSDAGWGNPIPISESTTREQAIAQYRAWVLTQPELLRRIPTLHGKVLGCWCHPQACHGDALSMLVGRWAQSKAYAGVGSRETPPAVLAGMRALAAELAGRGFILRSGAAAGADTAFEEGAAAADGAREIYLPWPGFNGRGTESAKLPRPKREAFPLAAGVHKAWTSLGPGPQSLHARNAHQVFGVGLNSPARFVVCWTKDACETGAGYSRGTGGTGMAIVLASRQGIPVLNMANPDWRQRLDAILAAPEVPLGAPMPEGPSQGSLF